MLFACAAPRQSSPVTAIAAADNGEPNWVDAAKRHVVRINAQFELRPEAEDLTRGPEEKGSGFVVGMDVSSLTFVTAKHVVARDDWALVSISLQLAASVRTIDLRVKPEGSTGRVLPRLVAVELNNELQTATIGVEFPASELSSLAGTFTHFDVQAPSNVARSGESMRFIVRRDSELSVGMPRGVDSLDAAGTMFPMFGGNVQQGCSGGVVIDNGKLLGMIQSTDNPDRSDIVAFSKIYDALIQAQPSGVGNRSFIQPFGVVELRNLPQEAQLVVDSGIPRAALVQNQLGVGRHHLMLLPTDGFPVEQDFAVASHEIETCEIAIATSESKWRRRTYPWIVGGGLAAMAFGSMAWVIADNYKSDFKASWSPEDYRHNQNWFKAGKVGLYVGTPVFAVGAALGLFWNTRGESSFESCKRGPFRDFASANKR